MAETGAEAGEYLQRGVANPEIVDLVTTDPRRGHVVLVLIEDRGWGLGKEQLEQLNDKLSNYFVYVIDGHLAEQYPQYAGWPVRIQLDTTEEPSPEARTLLREATRVGAQNGLAVVVRVLDREDLSRAPWET